MRWESTVLYNRKIRYADILYPARITSQYLQISEDSAGTGNQVLALEATFSIMKNKLFCCITAN